MVTRRRFLARALGVLAAAPALRHRAADAQARVVRIGAIHPARGPLADVGLTCRLAIQLAVDTINAAGGIASLGGARLELLVGDSASAAGARAEAERLIDAGARVLVGAFHSGHTATIAAVARLRRTPLLVDTAVADAAMLGASEASYVFRTFPTTSAFARRAVQYLVEIFADAQRPITRAALLHTTDPLGTTQARRFEAAYAALRPSFEMMEFVAVSPRAMTLTNEIGRVRAGAPDLLVLAVRPSLVAPLFRQLSRDPLPLAAILSVGTPDLAEAARTAGIIGAVERVMELAPAPNMRNPRTQQLAEEFAKRSGGRPLDAVSGYAYEAVLVVADALQRAASADPDAVAEALRRTSFANPLMVSAGPITFDATGENVSASPAVVQVLGARPVVVWPRAAAERHYVLSRV